MWTKTVSAQPIPDYPQFVFYTATAECKGSQNGKIRIFIDESKIPLGNGWELPFEYRYENIENGDVGSGICVGAVTEILHLTKGTYKVFVDLDARCMVTGSVVVEEEQNTLDLLIQKDNGINCNGATLTADVLGGLPSYNYKWSSGSIVNQIQNLNTGNYCVTVTDAKGCKISDCENVEDFSVQVFVSDFQNVSECLNANYNSKDGFIKTEVVGNKNTSYNYAWTGPNGFNVQTKDLNNLKPGSYNLTVTNSVGCSAKIQKNLCCCDLDPEQLNSDPFACFGKNVTPEINLDANIVHPTKSYNYDGQINLSITGNGAKGSLSYNWSGPGSFKSYKKDISNLSIGEYCVTVTDGCTKVTKCFELYSCKIEFKVNNACKYYDDGEIIVKLYNPNLYLYQIENNGLPLPTSTPEKYFEYHISDLLSGSENEVDVTLDECIASQHITIKEQELTEKLSSTILSLCQYDAYCNNNLIQENSKVINPPWNFKLAQGDVGLFDGPCELSAYCQDNDGKYVKAKTIEAPILKIKAGIYLNLLDAGYSVFDPYYLQQQRDQVLSKIDVCGDVRYCPLNLDCVGTYGSLAGNCGGLTYTSENQDCSKLDCCWIDGDNYEWCICDIVPFYLKKYCLDASGNNDIPLVFCNPKRKRVYDLIYNYNSLLSIPNFQNSELDIFLHKVMDDPELLKKSICGFVNFCGTNFDRVTDNLYEVNCEPVDYVEHWEQTDFVYNTSDTPAEYPVWATQETCILKSDENGKILAVCNRNGQLEYSIIESPLKFNSNSSSENSIVNFIPASLNFSRFQNFSNSFKGNSVDPKGLFIKKDDTYYVESASDYKQLMPSQESKLRYFHDDWGKDIRVLIEEIQPKAMYRLSFQQNGTNKIFGISNDFITIEGIFENDLKVFVVGTSLGNMNIGGQAMIPFDTLQYFIASFDTSGQFLNMDKIKYNGKLDFSFSNAGVKLVGIPKTPISSVLLNGVSSTLSKKLMTVQKNSFTGALNLIQALNVQGDVCIVKSVSTKNDSINLIIVKGTGNISDQFLTINLTNDEVLGVILDFNNNIKGHFELISPKIESLPLGACINNNGDIFVGATFTDSLQIKNGEQFISNGKQDIILAKLNQFGNIMDTKQYGSEQDESIIELMADNKNVFIGGNLTGPLTQVTIGNIKFKTNSVVFQTGYTSYLPINEFSNTSNETRQDNNVNQSFENYSFSIFPNPTSNELFIKCNTNVKPYMINLYDINGVEKLSLKEKDNNQTGIYKLDLNNLPPAYYFITIQNTDDEIIFRQSIIKI